MARLLPLAVVTVLASSAALWVITRPAPLDEAALTPLSGDPAHGEAVFWAAGCASCHAAEGARGEARLVLSGGERFETAFGTFRAPNISSDPVQGIGAWTLGEFANAIQRGIGRQGEHLYPALPYTSYIRMAPQDVADLRAFMATLPADPTPSQPHELAFPFSFRPLLGAWKMLNLSPDWVLEGELSPEEARGRYLVEAMGHCGECHTPRNAIGGLEVSRWLAGAALPSGSGQVPGITPAQLEWSEDEIVEYLTSGTTPDWDSAGGKMSLVVDNFSRLPEEDRMAVAAYLKRVPAAE